MFESVGLSLSLLPKCSKTQKLYSNSAKQGGGEWEREKYHEYNMSLSSSGAYACILQNSSSDFSPAYKPSPSEKLYLIFLKKLNILFHLEEF